MDDPESIIERFDASTHDAINYPNRVLEDIRAELDEVHHEVTLARKAAEEARKASIMTIAVNLATILGTVIAAISTIRDMLLP